MLVTLFGIVTPVKELQCKNAPFPMLLTPSSIVTFASELHVSNTLSSMLIMLPGIVTLVKEPQFKNADSPILVTLSGIVTLAREMQVSNA